MPNKKFLSLALAFTAVTSINARNYSDNQPVQITQNATFFMPGQEIKVSIVVNANSSTRVKEIVINGSVLALQDGVALYISTVGSLGVHEIPVKVSFFEKNEGLQTATYNIKYEVGQPNTSIALDKMNVLFIGVDNPVSISSSVGGDQTITVATKGGGSTITKAGPGQYNVRVTEMTDDCMIYVSVDGKVVAASTFRVRNLPVPIGTVGGYSSGDMVDAAKLAAQAGVGTYVKDFPISFKCGVESYTLSVSDGKGETKTVNCEGAKFSAEAIAMLKNVKSGSMVIIGNIIAKDEAGRKLKLAPLVYYIK